MIKHNGSLFYQSSNLFFLRLIFNVAIGIISMYCRKKIRDDCRLNTQRAGDVIESQTWANTRGLSTYRITEQSRLRQVCAYAQTRQSLRCSQS